MGMTMPKPIISMRIVRKIIRIGGSVLGEAGVAMVFAPELIGRSCLWDRLLSDPLHHAKNKPKEESSSAECKTIGSIL
jgi:hypothetical protein